MTVAQLIERLQAYPPDRPVEVWSGGAEDWMDADDVFVADYPTWPHTEPSVRITS